MRIASTARGPLTMSSGGPLLYSHADDQSAPYANGRPVHYRSILGYDAQRSVISTKCKNKPKHAQHLVMRRGVGVHTQAKRIVFVFEKCE